MNIPGLCVAEAAKGTDESPTFRSASFPDELVTNLRLNPLHSCWDFLVRGGSQNWERAAFGTREGDRYVWLSYRDFAELSFRFANGLTALRLLGDETVKEVDICPRTGSPGSSRTLRMIGLFCRNRIEWVIADQAANLIEATLVPLYATLGAESMRFILKQTKLRTAVVAIEHLDSLLNFRGDDDALDTLILLPPTPCLDFRQHCGQTLRLPMCSNCGCFESSPMWTGGDWMAAVTRAREAGLHVRTIGEVLCHAEDVVSIPACLPPSENLCIAPQTEAAIEEGLTQASPPLTPRDKRLSSLPAAPFSCLLADGLFQPQLLRPQSTMASINTVCYTSGTTGFPKGALLSHRGNIAIVAAIQRGLFTLPGLRINSSDTHYSYLPLAHVLERCIVYMAQVIGARSGFASGNTQELVKDLAALQPTVFLAVPRVLSVMDSKVSQRVQTLAPPVRWAIESALRTKLRRQQQVPERVSHAALDVVLTRIRKLLGGKVKVIICGGAPLDPGLQARVACLFSAPVVQGFGMTESYGPVFVQPPQKPYGAVGPPLPAVEYKILAKETSNSRYFPEEQGGFWEGELCLRGPVTVEGYFASPDASAELYAPHGWLRTGDVASLSRATGELRIVDRVKSLFKLAQGEYVAPEKLEGVYATSSWIAQVFVTGDPLARKPVAIVVPDAEIVACRMKRPLSAVLADENLHHKLKTEILKDMKAAGEDAKLMSFEKVHNIMLREEPFTVENNLMTPTMKLRRRELRELLNPQIQQLYQMS